MHHKTYRQTRIGPYSTHDLRRCIYISIFDIELAKHEIIKTKMHMDCIFYMMRKKN